MGSPANPTPAQVAQLEKASALTALHKPQKVNVTKQQATIRMQLPRQAVSLIKLTY